MRILHYSLGFPPYRTGGLTKFCMDLMAQQYRMGHQVALMWPGCMGIFCKNTIIKQGRTVKVNDVQIISYEIMNTLPVPYDEGIADVKMFMCEGNPELYEKFLREFKPDAIHIHTMMGLQAGLLRSAQEMNIQTVFTAHDFFPVCPKVTMFRRGKICQSVDDCVECGLCNSTALGVKKIMFLQSSLYRFLKDTKMVKYMRKRHRDDYLSEKSLSATAKPVGTAEDYLTLRKHYGAMLQMVGKIHYNSSITKDTYERIFILPEGYVIPISHSDIADHRVARMYSPDMLRIRYLGPGGGAKGFFFSGRRLIKCGKNARISVWTYILLPMRCRHI